jgi:hypothetical protein
MLTCNEIEFKQHITALIIRKPLEEYPQETRKALQTRAHIASLNTFHNKLGSSTVSRAPSNLYGIFISLLGYTTHPRVTIEARLNIIRQIR